MTELGEFSMFLALGFGFLGFFFGPIGKALARRIGGDRKAHDSAELDEIRARVDELESQQHRMAELEERVDFAERLLASMQQPQLQGREGDR